MMKDITNKTVEIIFKNENIQLPPEIKEKIDKHWEEVKRKTPELWNGVTTCFTEYQEDASSIKIVCKQSDYAHYIYDERIGLPPQYACSNISAGCLLETLDGYYIVGELDERTSYPYCMQISGGNVDKKDLEEDGKINILETIRREVQEEININLDDNKQVRGYQLKYISLPNDREHGCMIFAVGTLNMTAEEFKQYYARYLKYLRENSLEVEFGKVHLIEKERSTEILDGLSNPKRGYLKPLLEQVTKDSYKSKRTLDTER